MSTDYKFKGWSALDKDSVKGKLVYQEFTPKNWQETDVDIQITHCGICASDMHTISGGWGEIKYPIVVGHEIVGKAVRVGSEVKHVKVGDRVGVGAQSGSCLQCGQCKKESEPYCDNGMVGTYNGTYPDGSRSSGGYADYARVPSHFVVQIPESLPSEIAAPMLCGGVTVYSPLKQNGAGTTAKNVGIVGIGGLGHFGILFASALGAEVTAISHSANKKADALEMGAKHFIETGQEGWEKKGRRTLDLIICTANEPTLEVDKYLQLLVPGGKMVLVGVPEKPMQPIPVGVLLFNNTNLGGSLIGGPTIINEMLALAASKHVKTWVEPFDLDQVNEAVVKFNTKGMRYRAVLFNKKNIENQ